ncbi:hypothetical protein SAMN05421858_2780 [Haladaptatus litoreus]|uniref:Uncharacterized protein n=1 Tax=Haladaptatus litoreus TaxID=553468 RepID=A0A1N7BV59_9EURY|nr:hypothetical protein [Haladaptatus litoreus]SIR55257.1 hypothetical protein SAMN05421858_2780 [Haladaptatus litoreus]
MRPRPPRLQAFSIALGVVAGTAVFLLLLWLSLISLQYALGIGLLVAFLGWIVAEQVPDQLDWAVVSRLHWLLTLAGILPFVGIFGAMVLAEYTPSDELVLYSCIFAFVAIIGTACGSRRNAKIQHRTQTIHVAVSGTKLRRYYIPLTLVPSIIGVALVHLALSGRLSVGTFVGQIIGTFIGMTIGYSVSDDRTVTLTALDDCFLVGTVEKAGGTAVPWRRIRGISVEDDTLRVARGLPWPMVYEVDLSGVSNRDTVLEAFRPRLR